MKPSQVSAVLVHIAAKIKNSQSPNRSLVIQDLKNLINKVAVGTTRGITVFNWDEIDGELHQWDLEVPVDLPDDSVLNFADQHIKTETGWDEYDEEDTYNRSYTRKIGDVWIMDGKFGQDKDYKVYYSKSPEKAKRLAEQETATYLNE